MRLTSYLHLKPTGIEWLGDVPDHWEVKRLKWSVTGCFNGVWGDEPDGTNDVVCVRVADFNRDTFSVRADTSTIRSVEPTQLERRKLVKGDLLIEKSGGGEAQLVGCVVHFDHDFDAVCSNFVARMPVAPEYFAKYWCYSHAALYAGKLNYPAIKQTTGIQNLDSSEYLNTLAAYPPPDEQQQIAAFLDWKTEQIDALIARKKELLEKLKEARLAVITQAVTRGVNPATPFRDSGIPWVGQVPAHWEVKRLRFAVERIEQGWSPQCDNQPADDGCWGVMKVGCVNGDTFDPLENKALPPGLEAKEHYELKSGDIIISRANTKDLLGSAAIVPVDVRPKLLLCDKLYRVTTPAELDEEFLTYYLRTPIARYQYEREATGASDSMQNIGQDTIKNLVIPLPKLTEQKVICQAIRESVLRLDELMTATVSAMARLTEYRTALITAATMGKIDVRKVKIPSPVA
jgi:type I restriction enzyme, S subunit